MIYIREPEPGHPFRIWITADDLGLHVKLPGELEVDKATGQIHSIVLGTPKTEGIPQAPLREVKLVFKSGFRAPLVNPQACGTYRTEYEFVPWSGNPSAPKSTTMQINEGCDTGGFNPKLSAGSTDATGGAHSPFLDQAHIRTICTRVQYMPRGRDRPRPRHRPPRRRMGSLRGHDAERRAARGTGPCRSVTRPSWRHGWRARRRLMQPPCASSPPTPR